MANSNSNKNSQSNNEKPPSSRGKSKKDTLTPKQQEVLKLLAEGMTNKEIASNLNLSSKTVDAHRASIMTRLRIYDLPGLIKYALINNLTSLD